MEFQVYFMKQNLNTQSNLCFNHGLIFKWGFKISAYNKNSLTFYIFNSSLLCILFVKFPFCIDQKPRYPA